MKKIAKIILAVTFVFATTSVFAEVDEDEIRSVSNQTIVFENYTGPHDTVDTLSQIQQIGTNLATNFDINVAANYGNEDRYYVIHAVENDGSGKLDADIFIIGRNAGVDHVRNLRHIVASYLANAYDYEYNDAYTLATFITVYNAVYRGNLNYFQQKYKTVVTQHLTADKAGLAISYRDWPGATQMVIPLANLTGGLSTIDTSVISDKNVVDSMREEDDKGIDERKNMVDIKEREAEEATEKAQDAQKTVTEQEKILQEEKDDLKEKQETAEQKKTEADEAQQKADESSRIAQENPNDKDAQKTAEEDQQKANEAQQESEKAQDEVRQQEEVVKEQETKTEEARQTARDEQAIADRKNTEAQQERTQIANDQREVIQQSIIEETTAIYALKVIDDNKLYSAITKVNRNTGEELKTSPVRVIRNRMFYPSGANFIAIAGENGSRSAVKLVQIDKTNLEIVKESKEIIAEKSLLVQFGNEYFAIVNENNKNYLAKFNADLECTVKSPVEINPATPIVQNPEGYCVTDTSGKIIILNTSDLTKKEQTSRTTTGDER